MKSLKRFFYLTICTLTLPLVVYAGPVNVNTADAETISAELQGVGISKALAIVDYRKAHGPFKSADDLTLVKGIGERTVEINRANILVKSSDKTKKK
jgi:competence protein ComEA